MQPLRLATRGSRLALWQTRHVADLLRPLVQPQPVELVIVQTTGDRLTDRPLSGLGGQGAFTKEIQQALLDGRADAAIHSLKDLPTQTVPGLVLAATPARGPVEDAFVSSRYARFQDLPHGALVATGSIRRMAQLLHYRPDLRLQPLRGNVETRLRKIREGECDGGVLALAGLERLGLTDAVTEVFAPTWMIPAVGQGALGIECREEDRSTRAVLAQINHAPTFQAISAERAFLRELGGGCSVPIAALGQVIGPDLILQGMVCSPDGRRRLADRVQGDCRQPEAVGQELARRLLDRGAAELLA